MITQLLTLLVLSSGGILAIMLSKETKFAIYYPITCMSIVILLFVFGVCDLLLVGFYFILAIVVLIYIAFVIFLIRTILLNNRILSYKYFFTPGTVFFILIFIWITWRNSGRVVHLCDEFSHWATVVKQMYLTNTISTSPKSSFVIFKSYPPGMALFQYFNQKMYNIFKPNMFCEWRLYFSYQLFALSLFVPFVENLSFRKPISFILTILSLHIPLVFFNSAYDNLQIDSFLGCLAGVFTAMIFCNKTKTISYYLFIFLAICTFVLTKDAGIFFGFFACILFIVSLYLEKADNKKTLVTISAVSLVVPKLIWEINMKTNNTWKQFSQKIDFKSLLNVILGKEVSYRTEVIENYVGKILGKSDIGFSFLKISYPVIFLFLIFMLIVVFLKYRKEKPYNYIYVIIISIEMLAYIVGLLIVYMYKFSKAEAIWLSSFSRYFGIVLNMVWFFTFLTFMESSNRDNEKADSFLSMIIGLTVILSINWAFLKDMFNKEQVLYSVYNRKPYEEFCDQIISKTEKKSRVFLISQDNLVDDYLTCRFLLMPIETNNIGRSCLGVPQYEGDSHYDISVEEWKKELKKDYDYVAIYSIDDEFVEKYHDAFHNPNNIVERGIYSVDENGLLAICS